MLSSTTPNGHLLFSVEDEDRDDIAQMLERHGQNDKAFLVDMLDHFGFTPNGRLYAVNPEDVGALTDAPLVATEVERLDDGGSRVHGSVWWYPSYEVINFAEALARDGKVIFTKA